MALKAPPLVLLHGYPFDHTMWGLVAARLTCDLITPDLPGFGRAPLSSGAPSVDLMADDVARMLDQLKIQDAIVAGFSMGGYVALAFAEGHPGRLAGLGLINSQTLADTDEVRAGRRTMIEKVRREGAAAAAEAAVPKLFARPDASKSELGNIPRKAAEQAGVSGISWALEAMARRPDRTSVLDKLQVPILLIHSTEDKFIPVERARTLAQRIPKALFIEVEGVGHCSPLEAPEIVAKALGELVGAVQAQSQ